MEQSEEFDFMGVKLLQVEIQLWPEIADSFELLVPLYRRMRVCPQKRLDLPELFSLHIDIIDLVLVVFVEVE